MNVYAYIHICTYMYTHTHVYIHTHKCTGAARVLQKPVNPTHILEEVNTVAAANFEMRRCDMHACTYTWSIRVYVEYTCVCIHAYNYVCVCVCVCACVLEEVNTVAAASLEMRRHDMHACA